MALPFGSYDSVKNRQNRSLLASTQFEDDSYHIMDIEIDKKGLETCQTGLCNLDGQELVLLKYHEVPEFLRGNPYVVHGYRSLLPFNMCMKRLVLQHIYIILLYFKLFFLETILPAIHFMQVLFSLYLHWN